MREFSFPYRSGKVRFSLPPGQKSLGIKPRRARKLPDFETFAKLSGISGFASLIGREVTRRVSFYNHYHAGFAG